MPILAAHNKGLIAILLATTPSSSHAGYPTSAAEAGYDTAGDIDKQ